MKILPLKLHGPVLAVLFLAAVFSGCAIFSLHPFYTAKNRIDVPPELVGLWRGEGQMMLRIQRDGKTTLRLFSVRDGKDIEETTEFQAVFFRIGDTLYADATLNPEKLPAGGIAPFMLVPTHNLYRVELAADQLAVWYPLPLPEDEKTFLELPHVIVNSKAVFTATGEEWAAFLEKHGALIFPAGRKEGYRPEKFRRELVR